MSICSNTLRALPRSRIPPSRTLLPFLYQTSTIQQWHPATRSIARRNITSPSRSGDEIPFENLNDESALEDPKKTTITGSERAAFQKLYRKFNTKGRRQNEKDHVVELDQIADEYYEDDEDSPKPDLDKVFDEVLKGAVPRTVPRRSKAKEKELGQHALLSIQRTVESELDKAASATTKDAKMDTEKFKEMRLAERERVDKLIRNAPTDRALWQILEQEVFEPVRNLDLDNTNGGSTEKASEPSTVTWKKIISKRKPEPTTKSKPSPPTTSARILFQNYPHHLVTAVHTLRTEFPSSPYPFSILPTIKALGRSSHALGATTALYKYLIRTAWIQQASYIHIDTLLTEMDNTAIEFDSDVLTLLDAIIKEHSLAQSGRLGQEMQMVYGMELWMDGIKKMNRWRYIVAERLGAVSQQRMQQGTAIRKMEPVQGREKAWRGIGVPQRDPRAQGYKKPRGDMLGDHVPLVEGVNMLQGDPLDMGKSSLSQTQDAAPFTEDSHQIPEIDSQEDVKIFLTGSTVEQPNEQPNEQQNEQKRVDEDSDPTDEPSKALL